ncbi:MAG: hypothetical protein MJ069_05145 [Salinivirgaceae bacterium]|nr:hypothetical protein [Salinivirgaceae bacterium]
MKKRFLILAAVAVSGVAAVVAGNVRNASAIDVNSNCLFGIIEPVYGACGFYYCCAYSNRATVCELKTTQHEVKISNASLHLYYSR